MGATLPPIPASAFEDLVSRFFGAAGPLSDLPSKLHRHYEELRRWNRRLSLVGPGTASEVLDRHYGESLAAVDWLPREGALVDVGSGAGFPGFVLAAAVPTLAVTLVEAQARKWAFLESCRRVAGLSYACLDARVASPLPPGIPAVVDVVTSRAVRLTPEILGPLLERSPDLRLLLWQGGADPALPAGLRVIRQRPLPGSDRRRLVEIAAD